MTKYTFILLVIILPTFSYSDEVFDAFPERVKQARSAVHRVEVKNHAGTGFFIGEKTFVFNFHGLGVLDMEDDSFIHDIEIWNEEKTHRFQVKNIKSLSANYDLVVLETEEAVENYLTLGSTLEDPSFEVNGPCSQEKSDEEESFTELFSMGFPTGNFSAVKRIGSLKAWTPYSYSFFTNINRFLSIQGASGSPIINSEGEVLGISSRGVGNMYVAIDSSYIQKVLDGKIGVQCLNGSYKKCVDDTIRLVQQAAHEGIYVSQHSGIRVVINHFKNQFTKNEAQGNLKSFFEAIFQNEENDLSTNSYTELMKHDFDWLLRSANQNDTQAQYMVSLFYEGGISVEQDYRKAFKWAKTSAEKGYAPSEHLLGMFYYLGEGIDRDFNQSLFWLERSANQGFIEAQRTLAGIYEEGFDQNSEYSKKAFHWHKKAAEIGDIRAQRIVSMYYLQGGIAVEKDEKQFLYWMEKSARGGDAQAQFMMFLTYYGKVDATANIDLDIDLAVDWLIESARNNFARAQYFLGYMYYKGENGVEKNITAAIYWLEQAAKQGYGQAETLALSLSRSQMSPLEKIIDIFFSDE